MLTKPAPASIQVFRKHPLLIRVNEGRCGLLRCRQQVFDHVLSTPLEQVHVSDFFGNMNGDELALDRCQGTDRVHFFTIAYGESKNVASWVLIAEHEICHRAIFRPAVAPLYCALDRLQQYLEPAFAAVVAFAKGGAQLLQPCARDILVSELQRRLIVNNLSQAFGPQVFGPHVFVPQTFAAAALEPRPDPFTIDKIGKALALSLDPVRCEIDQLRFWPAALLERTIARRRDELEFGVVNCNLDSGCIIEGKDCTCKKGDA